MKESLLNSKYDYNIKEKKKPEKGFWATLVLIVLLILNYWVGSSAYSICVLCYALFVVLFFDPIYLLVPCFLVDTIQSYFMVTESLSFNLALVMLFLVGFLLQRAKKIKFSLFDFFLVLFAVYILMSSFFSLSGDMGPGVSFVLTIILLIFVRSYDHERIKEVFNLLIITAFLFSAVIMVQTLSLINGGGMSQVVFDDNFNANTIAGCISILLAIIYGGTFLGKPKNKLISYAFMGVGAVVILFVGSRTALIALLVAVIFVPMCSGRNKDRKIVKSFFSFVSIALILGVALWLVMKNNTAIMERFTFSDTGGVESITRRTDVWETLIKVVIPENFFVGVGFGLANVKLSVTPYLRFPKHAHNMFLAIIAETGLIGAIQFCIFFIYTIKTFLKKKSVYFPLVISMLIVGFISGIGEEIIDRRWFWLIFAFGYLSANYGDDCIDY